MIGEKFTLMQYPVHAILGLIDAGQFVIPEIQRPFVWKRKQVRDLIDSNGGFICNPKDPSAFAEAFNILNENRILCQKMGNYNRGKVQAFSADVVKKELYNIYKQTFTNKREELK